MKNTKLTLAMMMMAMVALFAVGCSDDDEDNMMNSQPELSQVMVVHASPDAPAVDLVVDNTVAGSGLTFPANTGYLEVPAGTRNIKVRVTADPNLVPIEANLTLNANTNYSVFAIDSVSSIEPLVIVDDLTPPAEGIAHVRFIHLSPDAPAVNITTTNNASTVFGNIAFKEYTAFTPLPAGSYDLEVRLAANDGLALDLPTITLEAGKIYTVFAKGFAGGSGSEALGAEIIVNN